MKLTGRNIIGFSSYSEGTVAIQPINPNTNEVLSPLYFKATVAELNLAIEKATSAFQEYRNKTGSEKAIFLEKIAENIENLGDTLIDRYMAESALPQARAIGERGRTVGQLRLFAQLLREGSWVNARIDSALPNRQPLPRPHLASMERPLGIVGVFGASNFPLAFSVAGGDTTAALAAGCCVIFKAHAAHLGTSEMVGKAIQEAAEATNMPDGVFSMLFDEGYEIGQALVKHPAVKAIAFTGSFKGGKAIYDAAQTRLEPIPVYAEMGSINPVFVLPTIIQEKAKEIAQNYMASVTLGVGQFCTNPGMIIFEQNPEFIDELNVQAINSTGGVMLTEGIKNAYLKGIEKTESMVGATAKGKKVDNENSVESTLFFVDSEAVIENPHLSEEIFGPASVVVSTTNREELLKIAKNLSGHLTATVFGTEKELEENRELLSILEQKVGRLLINGFPTGVEVCHSMVHGGVFPATTDSRTTSVGTMAITRFTRPVCYQNFSDALLPDELKSHNPLKIWRLVDGNFQV